MELRLLFIEDDPKLRENLKEIFHNEVIANYELKVQVEDSFEKGLEKIEHTDFDIVILDLFKDGKEKDENAGIKVLESIRDFLFVPVIFYTGHAHKISHLKSEIVGVVSKGDGVESLTNELERIITSKLALLKKNINDHIKEELRKYFWETVDKQKGIFSSENIDYSLGYLILRRISTSLSKENIKQILGDDKIKSDKAHPMEFYIFPINSDSEIEEYQSGELIEKEGTYYAILTPDCDFVLRGNGSRKADKILLAAALKFNTLPDFVKYNALRNKKERSVKENQQLSNIEGKLKNWMNNRGGEQDRFFFLPATPFIENQIIDFQNKMMVSYDELKDFHRIAKLDAPYAQSMISSFIRYYNRIGFPDIDTDYIMNSFIH